MAFFILGLVGAAVVTTMQDEAKSQGREWGWKGLISAMRRPSKDFLVRMTVHLPQMVTAVAIALNWRAKRCRSTNTTVQQATALSKSG